MNLFRPVPNANEKQQFCQIVKILVFNKCRKRWHMRKNSQKTLKNTEKRREPGGKRGGTKKTKKNGVFFHLTTWQGTYCNRPVSQNPSDHMSVWVPISNKARRVCQVSVAEHFR